MGRDKAFVVVDGRTLVERVVAAAGEAGASGVRCVGGDLERLRSLGLDVVADQEPGAGPLGGIVTALTNASHALVVVLSCDLVAPSDRAIRELVATATDAGADVTVPVVEGREQWLHAAWRRRCLPALKATFAAGERSVHRAAERLEVHTYDAATEGFADADRPDDLSQ